MSDANALIHSLLEPSLARMVTIPHDETRAQYRLPRNTVESWPAFEDAIADYYSYHYCRCVARGAHFSRTEALGQAKEILEQEYRRRHTDIIGAFIDARDGTNGGLRTVCDTIADALKQQSVMRYVTEQFDSRVAPHDFEAKTEIIRQFVAQFGAQLGDAIQRGRPERYAQDYRQLIQAYVSGLQHTSAAFRRL